MPIIHNPYAKKKPSSTTTTTHQMTNNKRPRPPEQQLEQASSALPEEKKSVTYVHVGRVALDPSSLATGTSTTGVLLQTSSNVICSTTRAPIATQATTTTQRHTTLSQQKSNPYSTSHIPADSWMRQVFHPPADKAISIAEETKENPSFSRPTTVPSPKPYNSIPTTTTIKEEKQKSVSISNIYVKKAPTALVQPSSSLSPAIQASSSSRGLASLRPESWNNKGTNPQETASSNLSQTSILPPSSNHSSSKPGVELPGEPRLPKVIAFSSSDVKPVNDEYRLQLITNAKLGEKLNNGWELKKHQKQALIKSLTMRRCILALDMGLGKTLIGCVYAKAFQNTFDRLKVFVICPVSMEAEWRRTAVNATGLQVESDKKSSKNSRNSDDSSLDLRICSWAKVPTSVDSDVDHFVVVCDEAHSMQSMGASRTQSVLQLVKDKR